MDFVSILAVLFMVVCIFLVLLILIQDPKGGGGGLFGGGGSNSILGASGATDLLSQMTKYTAIVFGALCIILTIATKPAKKGVFDKIPGVALEQKASDTVEKPEAETKPEAEATAPKSEEQK